MRKEWTASYGPANWPIARPLKSVFRGGSERQEESQTQRSLLYPGPSRTSPLFSFVLRVFAISKVSDSHTYTHTKIYTRNNKKYIYIHTRTREMQAFRAPHFRLSQDPRSTRFRIFDKIQPALRIPVSILSLFYFLFFFYYYYFFSSLELKIVKLFKQKKNKSKAEFVASVGLQIDSIRKFERELLRGREN